MAFVLFVEKRKLPAKIKAIFDSAEKGETIILIPAMVLAEIAYLANKQRIDATLEDFKNIVHSNPNFKIYPLNFDVIKSAFELTTIPELHDKLIAGSAFLENLPLLTNDPVITACTKIVTIW